MARCACAAASALRRASALRTIASRAALRLVLAFNAFDFAGAIGAAFLLTSSGSQRSHEWALIGSRGSRLILYVAGIPHQLHHLGGRCYVANEWTLAQRGGLIMKFLLRTACLVALAATPAIAADMPLKAPPMVAPVFSWTGFYIGVNAGAALETFDANTSTIFSPTGYFATTSPGAIAAAGLQTIDSTAFIWGGQAGYNWQTGNAVYGLEVDFDSLHHNASQASSGIYPCCAPTGFTVTTTANADWLVTIRPRVGMAVNNWLFYITGGAAAAKLNGSFVFTDTFATAAESASISGTKWGWVAGFGAETGFGGGWSLKGEFLYASFTGISGSSTNLTAFAPPIAFPTNVFSHSADFKTAIARVGLNYRFGGMY